MRLIRPATRLLFLLLPLALVAAATPGEPGPERVPSEQDLRHPQRMEVSGWVQLLPAPGTPDGWTPPPGARVAWPLRGTLTQPFGCTGLYLERAAQNCPSGFHTGIDLAQPEGTPIRAAADGLAYPFDDPDRYGNHVVVQHVAGYSTVYAHMVRTNVAWSQPVRAGDVIGWVGSTGNSTGPHLHFEVRFAAAPLDPMPYLEGSPADPFTLPAGWPGAPRDDWRGLR